MSISEQEYMFNYYTSSGDRENYFTNLYGKSFNKYYYYTRFKTIALDYGFTKLCNRLYWNLGLSLEDAKSLISQIDTYNRDNYCSYTYLDIFYNNELAKQIIEYNSDYYTPLRLTYISLTEDRLFI